MPPVEPMLATSVPEIPTADGMRYEPKWDGFRTIIFRDGDEVELVSRGGKTMTRYFPEVVEQVRAQLPPRCVIDGEIVLVRREDRAAQPKLDFELLQQRIHPAASRVKLLAERTPCDFVAFDLLALGDESLMDRPYERRRRAPWRRRSPASKPPVHLTPTTTDLDTARQWFEIFEGAGLDGLIAKPADHRVRARQAAHVQDQARPYGRLRGGRLPLPQVRAGGRIPAARPLRRRGRAAPRRRQRVVHRRPAQGAAGRARARTANAPSTTTRGSDWLEADRASREPRRGQRLPGGVSRWTGKKDLSWEPLRPELVVEVGYDAMEGDRFRHTAQFKRWRPDRTPDSCTYDQLERPVRFDVDEVLAGNP